MCIHPVAETGDVAPTAPKHIIVVVHSRITQIGTGDTGHLPDIWSDGLQKWYNVLQMWLDFLCGVIESIF